MNLFNKRVKYTPEIVTVRKGKPMDGVVIGEGQTYFTIMLESGKEVRVEKNKCEAV